MLKAILISLTFHAFVLFWALDHKPMDALHMESSHVAHEEEIVVTLRLNNDDLHIVEKKQVKKIRKVIKKKVVKQKKVSKPQPTPKLAQKKSHYSPKVSAELKSHYLKELRQFIESNKFYPRLAARLRHSGVVEIAFKVDEEGRFVDVHIHRGSSFDTLNEAALSLVKKLKGFKPLPKSMDEKVALHIPLRYAL